MAAPSNPQSDRLRRMVAQSLEGYQRAGVTHITTPRRRAAKADSVPPTSTSATVPAAPSSLPLDDIPSSPKLATREERVAALNIVREEVVGCTRCHELATTRTQTVFGVGNPMTRLCFVGEAPGADEDAQGEPFVGRAGQLLTKIIEACQLKREEVYILNVLKCRPPGNRTPVPDEVSNCRGYLDRQLAIIQPEVICCLGGVAATTLLETDQSIGRLRGRMQQYRGIPVMCTYHPAYLLRNPAAKREVWDDMKKLMLRLGVEL